MLAGGLGLAVVSQVCKASHSPPPKTDILVQVPSRDNVIPVWRAGVGVFSGVGVRGGAGLGGCGVGVLHDDNDDDTYKIPLGHPGFLSRSAKNPMRVRQSSANKPQIYSLSFHKNLDLDISVCTEKSVLQ